MSPVIFPYGTILMFMQLQPNKSALTVSMVDSQMTLVNSLNIKSNNSEMIVVRFVTSVSASLWGRGYTINPAHDTIQPAPFNVPDLKQCIYLLF